MTEFTDSIEATAESVEDLQKDLETLLEDLLGFGVTVKDASVEADEKYGNNLDVRTDLTPLERELERRLGVDEVITTGLSVSITPTVPEGDPE